MSTTTITQGPKIAAGARVTWIEGTHDRCFGIFHSYVSLARDPYFHCRVAPDAPRIANERRLLIASDVREATYTEEMFCVLREDRTAFREVLKVMQQIPLSQHDGISKSIAQISHRLTEICELLHDGQ